LTMQICFIYLKLIYISFLKFDKILRIKNISNLCNVGRTAKDTVRQDTILLKHT